jgi:hypothetical protein
LHNRVPMVAPRIVVVLTLAVAALSVSRSAAAAPITWFITGPVDHTSGRVTPVIPLGTPAALTISYESTTVSHTIFAGPGTPLFIPNISAELSVGSFTVPYTCACSFAVVHGGLGVEFFILGPKIPPGIPDLTFSEIRLLTGIAGNGGPTFGEMVGMPASAFASVQGDPRFNEGILRFSGPVVVQPTAVPEPATMTLFGTGLLAAWRARRKSR